MDRQIHPIIQEAIQEAATAPVKNLDDPQIDIPSRARDIARDMDGRNCTPDLARLDKLHPVPGAPSETPKVQPRPKGPTSRPVKPIPQAPKQVMKPIFKTEEKQVEEKKVQPVQPEPQEVPVEQEEVVRAFGPSQETIDKWKAQYGDVYSISLTEKPNDNFVFRAIMRSEWKELNTRVQGAAAQGVMLDMEEEICKQFVLWPNMHIPGAVKAGSFSTISAAIMEVSNFVPPQVVERLIQAL